MRTIILVLTLVFLAVGVWAVSPSDWHYDVPADSQVRIAIDRAEHLQISVQADNDSIYVQTKTLNTNFMGTGSWETSDEHPMYKFTVSPWNPLWECKADSVIIYNRDATTAARVHVRGY